VNHEISALKIAMDDVSAFRDARPCRQPLEIPLQVRGPCRIETQQILQEGPLEIMELSLNHKRWIIDRRIEAVVTEETLRSALVEIQQNLYDPAVQGHKGSPPSAGDALEMHITKILKNEEPLFGGCPEELGNRKSPSPQMPSNEEIRIIFIDPLYGLSRRPESDRPPAPIANSKKPPLGAVPGKQGDLQSRAAGTE
jgi:hypothetical protein